MTTTHPVPQPHSFLEESLRWFTLAILMTFTYARFFQAPYAGFQWRTDGVVGEVHVRGAGIEVADQLVQIGPVKWEDFRTNGRQTLFDGLEPGDFVPIIINRNGHALSIDWAYPGLNQNEFLARLNSEWFLPYAFWAIGILTALSLRPKDERWWMLIIFNYLTAFWLSMGGLTPSHTWSSPFLLRAGVWLSVPVYLHLHWVFPRPLGKLHPLIPTVLYLAAGLFIALEWFALLPGSAYFLGFASAMLGSFALLVVHGFRRRIERRDALVMLRLAGFVFVLLTAFGILAAVLSLSSQAGGVLLALPFIPGTYLYSAYRQQPGDLEVRANKIVAAYIFLTLIAVTLIIVSNLADLLPDVPGKTASASFFIGLLTAFIVIAAFPRFQQFFERRFLGIRIPVAELSQTYAARITASLQETQLAEALKNAILPALLISQSALLQLDDGKARVIYAQNVKPPQLPTAGQIPALIAAAGKYRPAADGEAAADSWIRLALALTIENKPVGLWLLGRHDPDDFYLGREIETLQSLANQTAIALSNISHTARLRALYQADIERSDIERHRLSLELHDVVLNGLVTLQMSVAAAAVPPAFFDLSDTLIEELRRIIAGFHPPVLENGLHLALKDLADQLSNRPRALDTDITFNIPDSDARYNQNIELHVFRIVQQACENAIKHGKPKTLAIGGALEENAIDLLIEDDGAGFETPNFAKLIANRHFGLAGMFERAGFINAEMEIRSVPGMGTTVSVKWQSDSR